MRFKKSRDVIRLGSENHFRTYPLRKKSDWLLNRVASLAKWKQGLATMHLPEQNAGS
ncbi:hypothetical protein BGS_0279 [Beggiatoa sp. SS]|nr:hypothetical protein BGS_0279 [Beggiatoa sp. SS]